MLKSSHDNYYIGLCVCVSSQTDSQGDGSYPRHPRTQRLHPQTQPLDQDEKILLPRGHRVHRPSIQHQVRPGFFFALLTRRSC